MESTEEALLVCALLVAGMMIFLLAALWNGALTGARELRRAHREALDRLEKAEIRFAKLLLVVDAFDRGDRKLAERRAREYLHSEEQVSSWYPSSKEEN